jgi:hypothetical protein
MGRKHKTFDKDLDVIQKLRHENNKLKKCKYANVLDVATNKWVKGVITYRGVEKSCKNYARNKYEQLEYMPTTDDENEFEPINEEKKENQNKKKLLKNKKINMAVTKIDR